MGKKAKKILIFLLTFAILISSLALFTSCASPYTDEEAREILASLLERDIELSQIIWGEGLETQEDPGEHTEDSTFYYMEVATDSAYTSLEELKTAVRETYSETLYATIELSAFGRNGGSENDIIPRYADTEDGFLQIDVTNEGFKLRDIAYIGDAKIVRGRKNSIKMDIKISSDSGETFREKRVVLLKENGVWKLDTQLWCVGYEY